MFKREDCRLRLLEEPDLPLVLCWRNDDRVRTYMFDDHIIALEEHLDWFARMQREKKHTCLVFELQGRPVGVVNLVDIDVELHHCRWGFYLGEAGLPQGAGTAMGFLGLEYAFETIGMHCLIGEVLVYNEASIRLHQRLGFREAGLMRALKMPGLYVDAASFYMLKSDWLSGKAELQEALFP